MKKVFFLIILATNFVSNSLFAEPLPRRSFAIGPEVFRYVYEEPGLNVELDGVKIGIVGTASIHAEKVLYQVELSGAWGDVDYSGSGSIDNIADVSFEGRILLGYDFVDEDDAITTLFTGFGYRHLNNALGGSVTSTGYYGYDRESSYFYLPIGAMSHHQYKDGWIVQATVEGDIVVAGTQKSNLSDVPGYSDASNDQNSGYGARASLKFKHKGAWNDFHLEPFIRYWRIDNSERSAFIYNGVNLGEGLEPYNTTMEYGINSSLVF